MEPPGMPPPSPGAPEPGSLRWPTETPKGARSRTPLLVAIVAMVSLFFLAVGLAVGYVISDGDSSGDSAQGQPTPTRPEPALADSCIDALASAELAFASFDEFYGETVNDYGQFGEMLDAPDDAAWEVQIDQVFNTLNELHEWELEFFFDVEHCYEETGSSPDDDRGSGGSGE